MLSSNYNSINPYRSPVDILNGNLAFPVGSQEIQYTVFSDFSKPSHKSVCIHNRHGHKFSRFITRIAKHQPLITCPLFVICRFIDTHGDIRWLLVDSGKHCACFPVKPHGRIVVSDLFNGLPDDVRNMSITIRGNLPAYKGKSCSNICLTRYPWFRVLFDKCIEYCIRNLIRDLVRMTFCNRFWWKKISTHSHFTYLLSILILNFKF